MSSDLDNEENYAEEDPQRKPSIEEFGSLEQIVSQ